MTNKVSTSVHGGTFNRDVTALSHDRAPVDAMNWPDSLACVISDSLGAYASHKPHAGLTHGFFFQY